MSSEVVGVAIKAAQRSHSDPSSNSRPIHTQLLYSASSKDSIVNDFALYGSPAPLRAAGRGSGTTVRRASPCAPTPKATSVEKDETVTAPGSADSTPRASISLKSSGTPTGVPEPHSRSDKIRKSLDNSYRLSLESISEDRTYASASLYPSIDCSSVESPTSSSECMSDYASRTNAMVESAKDSQRTIRTSSSSYMSWIESVNSEYFDNAPGNSERTGEWNNFWKTYNAPRSPYFVAPYLCSGLDDNSAEEFSSRSMCESSGSTQKDLAYKYGDKVLLSVEELSEAARCAQKIADILQNALKRAEIDIDDQKHEKDKKYMSDETRKNSATFLKVPNTGSSYIDAILTHTGGVAEILKKVINKRRESIMPDPEEPDSRRSSASGWSEVEIVHKK